MLWWWRRFYTQKQIVVTCAAACVCGAVRNSIDYNSLLAYYDYYLLARDTELPKHACD